MTAVIVHSTQPVPYEDRHFRIYHRANCWTGDIQGVVATGDVSKAVSITEKMFDLQGHQGTMDFFLVPLQKDLPPADLVAHILGNTVKVYGSMGELSLSTGTSFTTAWGEPLYRWRSGNPSDPPPEIKNIPKVLADRLGDLGRLQHNWDGYGASAISPRTIKRVESALREILAADGKGVPLPFIAPANDGTIVLEWKTPVGKELIIDVPPPDEPISFLLIDPEGLEGKNQKEGVIGDPWTFVELVQCLKGEVVA